LHRKLLFKEVQECYIDWRPASHINGSAAGEFFGWTAKVVAATQN
jgi:hypothetical protein